MMTHVFEFLTAETQRGRAATKIGRSRAKNAKYAKKIRKTIIRNLAPLALLARAHPRILSQKFAHAAKILNPSSTEDAECGS
jgi:hypothetical protein